MKKTFYETQALADFTYNSRLGNENMDLEKEGRFEDGSEGKVIYHVPVASSYLPDDEGREYGDEGYEPNYDDDAANYDYSEYDVYRYDEDKDDYILIGDEDDYDIEDGYRDWETDRKSVV